VKMLLVGVCFLLGLSVVGDRRVRAQDDEQQPAAARPPAAPVQPSIEPRAQQAQDPPAPDPQASATTEISVMWAPVTGASGYTVQFSVDMGTSWLPGGTAVTSPAKITIPNDKLVLIMVSAVVNGVTVPTCEKGAWYHGGWKYAPTEVGIQ
jgi:hypothetical protein